MQRNADMRASNPELQPLPASEVAPRRTRVCLIVENHWRAVMGGAPYQGRVIAEALAARPEFEVFFLARRCLRDDGRDPYSVIKIGDADGIRRRAVLFDAPRLWRTLKALDPDVVYQRIRQSYTAVAATYARRHGKRFVFHLAHDYDAMRGRTRRHLSLNTPFDIVEAALGMYGMVRADAIVAQTERQSQLLLENFGSPATAVIPNLHPAAADEERAGKPSDRFRVAWVANFKLFKRPELFVQLAEQYRDDDGIEFVMVGRPGEPEKFGHLHERIARLPNLNYLGEQSLEETNRTIGRSHVLVNTSELEGFSNTFIQAWLRDTAVISIAADIDGALADRDMGYLAGDFAGLCERLEHLRDNRSELVKVAQRARQYAERNYTTRNLDALIDLLRPARRSAATAGV